MVDITKLKEANARRWKAAKLTRAAEYNQGQYAPTPRIMAAKNRYEKVQAMTGVHWVFTACSHYRESNLNFARQLGQGDPLNRVSVNVPRGRGPFATFEDSAYDALVRCGPYASRNKDWSMPWMLTLLEMYNGLGYYNKGIPSPYVWAGTDQYRQGKYVSDGVFSATAVDKQLGVAGLIMAIDAVDNTISYPQNPFPNAIDEKDKAPIPDGPIINKSGEDIRPILETLTEMGHDVWEWLRHH